MQARKVTDGFNDGTLKCIITNEKLLFWLKNAIKIKIYLVKCRLRLKCLPAF